VNDKERRGRGKPRGTSLTTQAFRHTQGWMDGWMEKNRVDTKRQTD